MKQVLLLSVLFLSAFIRAEHQPKFSTAGFFQMKNSGREVFSMNVAWRFYKGRQDDASKRDFDDSTWEVVSLPHGIEYLPKDASGGINYQGEIWYRKHFTPDIKLKDKKLLLNFEAIMGKSKIWINGHLVNEHFGGYLPVIADISAYINWKGDNVIAVCADNSNDAYYPPGKPQETLDFAYFGGIYRDCWFVSHNSVYITNANYEDEVAGGGLLIAYDEVSEMKASITLKAHLRNELDKEFQGKIRYQLKDDNGAMVATTQGKLTMKGNKAHVVIEHLDVVQPNLWSPEHPYLYNLEVSVENIVGQVIDGYCQRIGIRSFEFRGAEGVWLNGKPYPNPLIGANRHQDFAVLGNALPNSLHWRDAKKLRDVGLKVIRNAHYPQDPAFMDACDELGLLVIVNTPGWQFWNEDPVFEERVYKDIRNMVRRDRNHASTWLWEPILNETWYPANFAKNTRKIVEDEFPYPNCYSACDAEARGSKHFDIQLAHPQTSAKGWSVEQLDSSKVYFTREWGDNVDDWNSHNSTSRVNRDWGEGPMLIQAQHYANPSYPFTSYDALYRTTRQHIGGCLWHAFDHQRGYHPDPFYGGIMDAFRQPKYSYELFKSQRSAVKQTLIAETGPMVFIAHEMTPFSSSDVTVYSNCDEVRLQVFEGGKRYSYTRKTCENGMPAPIIVFEGVYDFMKDKAKSRAGKQNEVFMEAIGYIDGKAVTSHKEQPSRRPEKVILWVDNEGAKLTADGSDCVTVVAAIADKNGNIKRLNNYHIKFEVEGEGYLVGDESVLTNLQSVQWGTAPVLVRATTKPGVINIKASVLFEGIHKPVSGYLQLESLPTDLSMLFDEKEWSQRTTVAKITKTLDDNSEQDLQREVDRLRKELNDLKLKEVEKQQEDFGEKTE